MAFFIQIQNGQAINHPAVDINLIQAFGEIPNDWIMFNRIPQPTNLLPDVFHKAINTYGLSSNGVTWEDKWASEPMTDAEKAALIAQTEAHPPGPNMTLNTTTLIWSPSIAKPTDGQKYSWDFQTGAWVVVPTTP